MRAVLFDLDGTLLDIDIDSFMRKYMTALTAYTEARYPGRSLMDAVLAGTREMMMEHPRETNREAFYRVFGDRTGIDLSHQWDVFAEFYEKVFPTLRNGAGPRSGAQEAVSAARDLGLKVAVATNPLFPLEAIETRLSWAGFVSDQFDHITSYEHSVACKPHVAYFEQVAAVLCVEPSACLMVGDDASLDMPATQSGMGTYYVGHDAPVDADHVGSLEELAGLLPRLAG